MPLKSKPRLCQMNRDILGILEKGRPARENLTHSLCWHDDADPSENRYPSHLGCPESLVDPR